MRSSACAPTGSCGCGTGKSSRRRRRGAAEMALPDWSAWAILVGVILAAAVGGLRPPLAPLAARNIGRPKELQRHLLARLAGGNPDLFSHHLLGRTPSLIVLPDLYLRLRALDQ